jgi:hypothetical protein
MPKYYIKYDSIMSDGRVFWLGSNNQWVDQQCNAVAYSTIDLAKAAFVPLVLSPISSQYIIVEEKVTFDVVLSGDQLISVKLNNLADKAWGYTHDHIAHEIRKIAKEIKQ